MFSFYHKNYNHLYNSLVKLSRNIYFYKKICLKDTFETRIILIFFHFSIILLINKIKYKKKEMSQKIFDNVFLNIEYHLREQGLGDIAVNKKMKTLNKIFYDILLRINRTKTKIFSANISLFEKHIEQFEKKDIKLNELEAYFNSFYNNCLELNFKDIIKGNIKTNF